MAPIVPAGTGVRASVISTLYGDVNDVVNTLWFLSGGSGGDLADLGPGIRDDYVNALHNTVISSFVYQAVNMVSYPPPAVFSLLFSTGFPIVGGAASSSQVAPANAYTVTFSTGLAGRAHRGRNFVAAIAPENFASGSLGTSELAALQSIWNGIHIALGGIANWTWVVAHTRAKNPNWQPNPLLTPFDRRRTLPVSPPVFSPITSVTVRPVLRQQRRREIGVSRRGARGGPSHVP